MTDRELITADEELLELAGHLGDARSVALDVETYPQDGTNSALDPRRGEVRLISVAARGGVAGVVDVTRVDPAPLLDALRRKTLIAHNAAFDLTFLKNRFGYEHDGRVADTMVLDAVLYYAAGPRKEAGNWKGFPRGEDRRRSLKDLAADYLGVELDKEEQTSDFGREELTEAQVRYSLRDAQVLLPLAKEMKRRLEALGLQKVASLETRVTPALAYCQNNGFALDVAGWREQALRAEEEAARLEAECDALAPPIPDGAPRRAWNWGSPKDVGEALELLGARLPKTGKGNRKTDEATLEGISSPKAAVRLAEALCRLRAMRHRASHWGIGWFDPPKKKPKGKKFDKKHQFVVDGRVYPSFNQVVKTGRMSCSSPNLQNIPSEFLRRYFVAPPGRKLLIADCKGMELVPAAVVSGEERMLEALRRGEDVHSLTARAILEAIPAREGRPASNEEIAEFRRVAKKVTFEILYGSTVWGVAKRLKEQFGASSPLHKAKLMVDVFFATYPSLARWYKEEEARAEAGEDLTRTLIGRLRLLDVVRSGGVWRAHREARLNTPIQGSAGDGFKHGFALTWERRHECPGDPKAVNLVHDEMVVEIDEEHAEAGKAWLERCMKDGMAAVMGPDGPVSIEITVGDSWADKAG
jgi:DNA polymerase-1